MGQLVMPGRLAAILVAVAAGATLPAGSMTIESSIAT
jgi:hypothetical protein